MKFELEYVCAYVQQILKRFEEEIKEGGSLKFQIWFRHSNIYSVCVALERFESTFSNLIFNPLPLPLRKARITSLEGQLVVPVQKTFVFPFTVHCYFHDTSLS